MPGELAPQGVELHALLEATDFDGARVLEVGSGDGRLTFRCAKVSELVVGVETSYSNLASAVAACPPDLRERISFVQATAQELPLRDESFNIAVFAWSL